MQLTVQTWITLSTFTMQTADSYKQRFYEGLNQTT